MSPRRSSASRTPSGRCTPGRPCPGRFNSFRIVEDYRTTTFDRGADVPPTYAWARQVARRIEQLRRAAPERPCHNDLLNANFIDDGRRVRIVDWEYAGMGDVFFDLANFAINHELDARRPWALLEAYFGAVRPDAAARARAHAVHVRLPRGDVGRRAGCRLDSSTSTSRATPPSTSSGMQRTAAEPEFARGASDGSGGGAERRPLHERARRDLGGEVEVAERRLLDPLELLLGAHRDGALEPLAGRQQVPAAEQEQRATDEDGRVVERLPGEVVRPRDARLVRAASGR